MITELLNNLLESNIKITEKQAEELFDGITLKENEYEEFIFKYSNLKNILEIVKKYGFILTKDLNIKLIALLIFIEILKTNNLINNEGE